MIPWVAVESEMFPWIKRGAGASAREIVVADATIIASALVLLGIWGLLPKDPFGGVASYLPFHMLIETLSIVVSLTIIGVVWNSLGVGRSSGIFALCCAMLAAGLLDFGHMLSVSGMPDFVTPSSPQKGIAFWLAARYIAAMGFLAAALLPATPVRLRAYRYAILAPFIAFAGATYWIALLHLDTLPVFFIKGIGLTSAKVSAEHFIISIQLVAAVILWRRARRTGVGVDIGLYAAVSLSVLSEAYFTFYAAAHDLFQVMGHVYKIIAYVFIYRAAFVANVREPFERLSEAQEELLQEVDARRRAEEELRKFNEDLEARVQQRTAELDAANKDLTRFNHAAVGRELQMIELKQQVNEFCVTLGQPQRYQTYATREAESVIGAGTKHE